MARKITNSYAAELEQAASLLKLKSGIMSTVDLMGNSLIANAIYSRKAAI